jgi:hypothetical protein
MKLKYSILILILSMLLGYSVNGQTVGDYNLLIVQGTLDTDAQAELTAMGHSCTIVSAASLVDAYDYSPYDAIIFMYNSLEPPGMSTIITENEACNLGIIAMRGESIINSCGLGTSMTWSDTPFTIENNTHWITQPWSLGVLDLSYTYNSNCTAGLAGTTILGSVSGGNGSLIVHDSYKRVVCPYYGHTSGMPWNSAADSLVDRVIAWAVDDCCTESTAALTEATCDFYIVPSGDETYTSSGIYMDTIPNSAGCDSVLTIDVTINTVDPSVTQLGEVLTANATAAAYQWIDCGDSSVIAGETSQNYTATVNGSYAVIVTENGCTDTSACFTVGNIGIVENSSQLLRIYPNPFDDNFSVNWSEDLGPLSIEITDIAGGVVHSAFYSKTNSVTIELNVPRGIYFINLNGQLYQLSKKIIRK